MTLADLRRFRAEEAFDKYDFSTGPAIEAANGWEWTSPGREYTRTIFLEGEPGQPSEKACFTVVFASPTSATVDECYARDMKGADVGAAATYTSAYADDLLGKNTVELLIEGARIHGEESEPDHNAGDLQEFVRAAWSIMSLGQMRSVLSTTVPRTMVGDVVAAAYVRAADAGEYKDAEDLLAGAAKIGEEKGLQNEIALLYTTLYLCYNAMSEPQRAVLPQLEPVQATMDAWCPSLIPFAAPAPAVLAAAFAEAGRDHPQHPVADWQHEVDVGDTKRGYWDWVSAEMESVRFDSPSAASPNTTIPR